MDIARRVPAIRLNGPPGDRLPGNLNLSFADVDGEDLMPELRQADRMGQPQIASADHCHPEGRVTHVTLQKESRIRRAR